jgi:excisionase family DNA binding protein
MAPKPPKDNPLPRSAYSVAEVAQSLGLSTDAVYALLDKGDIPSVRLGTRRVIPAAAFERWLADLNQPATA